MCRRRADAGDPCRRGPARQYLPDLRVRVVNVVDLMGCSRRPSTRTPCPTPSSTRSSADKPIIFAYHGYPWLIHRLAYRRTSHDNLHVRGYKEEGTTTTPFDMVVMNDMDRYKARHGRHRPGAGTRDPRRRRAAADGRQACRPPPVRAGAR